MASKKYLQIIFLTFILLSGGATTSYADQETTLRFSPIIIVDSNQTQHASETGMTANNIHNNKIQFPTAHHTTRKKLSIGDLDDYSLSLGATLHINDNLDIGAACGLPFVNEEPVQVEDLSIAAMVTMQF